MSGVNRAALGNRSLVRFTVAYFLAAMSEWAFFVGSLVYAFDKAGARTTGFAALALLIPTAIAGPAAGAMAHRHRPDSVRLIAFAVQAMALTGAAVAAYADAPVALVAGCSAVAAAAFTFLAPAGAVLLPAIVRSAAELTVGNVWVGACDSVGMLAGSAFATLLLAAQGPALVLAGSAALVSVSALMTLARRGGIESPPASHTDQTESIGGLRLVMRSIRVIGDRAGTRGVLAVAGGRYVLVGAMDLVLVVLANEKLHLGDSGPGLLQTCVGFGALISALGATAVLRRGRLSPLLVGSTAAIALVSLALGLAPAVATALLLLPIIGFADSLLDLTSRMLLQRATPPDAAAGIFGAIELFGGIGMVLGSIMAQVLIATGGVDTALIGLAAFFVLLLVLTWRALQKADDSADIPVVAISLLRRIPAFGAMPLLALEAVARTATEVAVPAGHVVMAEGDAGDRFYAVCDGSFDIARSGVHIRTVGRGDGFGEIALLANVPRTATVTATCASSVLAIDRVPFLVAVTGSDSSRQAAWGAIRTLDLDTQGFAEGILRIASSPTVRGVTAAQPTIQIDNERVKVTEWRFAPGAETGWHVHAMEYVVVPLYDGTLRIESSTGTTEVALQHGASYTRRAGTEHNVINATGVEYAFVEIELKPDPTVD